MTQENPDEDILLKLSMAGKSLRMKPQDAPQMPPAQPAQQLSQSIPAQSQPITSTQSTLQSIHQPQRETNTVVPPANTPPQSEEAQDDILRKLTMKPKEYVAATPTIGQVKDVRPPPGYVYQTPEEIRSNKPFVSTDSEVERVKKMAQNIYGSDMVQNRLKKK